MDARNRSSLVNSSQLSPSPFRHNNQDIPEFSSFEHQKENILPLKEGRSAASLSEVFSKDHALRTTQLASAHATFAAELDTLDELDDPLDVFNRYIKWTIENYPQGHNHESNLIPLLERATRTFKDDERYKKDPRYLRLWLLYAKYVEHPRDIFVFLENNEIGQDLAAFYEEYGALLESVKRFKEADQIYQLGIHRRARPLERLKRRFAAFQARVTVSYNPAETEDVQSLDPLAENPRRTVLGVKTSASSTRSAPQNVFNARDLNKSSALQSGNEAGSRQGGMASGISDRKLPIYYDPDGQRASTVLDGPISNTPWRDYGTELLRRQENIQESTKWKGVTLPMGRSPRTPLSEKFQVYCDKEEVREVQSSVVEQTPDVNASTKVDNSQSKHNDTRNVTSNTQNPSREPTKCVPYPRCHMKSTSMILAEIKQFGDKVAADVYSVYADDDEFCFEEIRANSKATTTPVRKRQKPSPTINTKLAMADILQLFNEPLHGDMSDSDSDIDYNYANHDLAAGNLKVDKENATENSISLDGDDTFTFRGHDDNKTPSAVQNSSLFSIYTDTTTPVRGSPISSPSLLSTDFSDTFDSTLDRNQYFDRRGVIKTAGFCPLTPISERGSEEGTVVQLSLSGTPQSPPLSLIPLLPHANLLHSHDQPLSTRSPSQRITIITPLLLDSLLTSISPPIETYPGVYLSDEVCGKAWIFERIGKRDGKSRSKEIENSIQCGELNDADNVTLFDDQYRVVRKLGEGGYARVYQVVSVTSQKMPNEQTYALKLSIPSTKWEFYVIQQLHMRLCLHFPYSPYLASSLISSPKTYIFRDESYLLLTYRPYGTLLDLVNVYTRENSVLDELLTLFFTSSLLSLLTTIHSVSILHNDIKPDNILLRLAPNTPLSSDYCPNQNGWEERGLIMIDFGSAVDLKLFNREEKFEMEWMADEGDCTEMREGRGCKWEQDYWRVAGVIYVMLFGAYMKVACEETQGSKKGGYGCKNASRNDCDDCEDSIKLGVSNIDFNNTEVVDKSIIPALSDSILTKHYKPAQPFKRYWQTNIWSQLFDILLNPFLYSQDCNTSLTSELIELRDEIDNYLKANCEKNGKSLKGLLRKLELEFESR